MAFSGFSLRGRVLFGAVVLVAVLGGVCSIMAAPAREAELVQDLRVGAYYYPWYDSSRTGRERHWSQGYIEEPVLGRYSSQDPTVIGQHIEWAKAAGIDFFVMSWWGPGDFTDTTLRYFYLRHPHATDVPIALFYEVKSRFKDQRIDFSDATNRALLVNDFKYMARNYFEHPAYLKFNGKPVVFIYLTRIFVGDYARAIEEVRGAVSELGYEIYLVADEPYHGSPTVDRATLFDAVSPYNMHSGNMPEDDWDELLARTKRAYERWEAALSHRTKPIFFPNAMPGFNDWGVRAQVEHPRFYPSPDRFRSSLELALKYVDPRLPVLMITSFNEWHEDTQIEPSEKYGEDYLETLQDLLRK